MDYNCIELHLQHHLQHKSPHFRISTLILLVIVIPTLAADDFPRIDPLGKQILFKHSFVWPFKVPLESCICKSVNNTFGQVILMEIDNIESSILLLLFYILMASTIPTTPTILKQLLSNAGHLPVYPIFPETANGSDIWTLQIKLVSKLLFRHVHPWC